MPQALTGVEAFRDWIYVAVVAMEVFTVVIIVAGIILGAATFLQVFFQRGDHQDVYLRGRCHADVHRLRALELGQGDG